MGRSFFAVDHELFLLLAIFAFYGTLKSTAFIACFLL